MSELETALQTRKNHPLTSTLEAYRVFHGPTESRESLKNYAVDRYGDYAWITHWAWG